MSFMCPDFRPNHTETFGGEGPWSIQEQRGCGLGRHLLVGSHNHQRRFCREGPDLGWIHRNVDQNALGHQVGRPGAVCLTGPCLSTLSVDKSTAQS